MRYVKEKPLSEKVSMYRKNLMYTGFGTIYGFRHPPEVLEHICCGKDDRPSHHLWPKPRPLCSEISGNRYQKPSYQRRQNRNFASRELMSQWSQGSHHTNLNLNNKAFGLRNQSSELCLRLCEHWLVKQRPGLEIWKHGLGVSSATNESGLASPWNFPGVP